MIVVDVEQRLIAGHSTDQRCPAGRRQVGHVVGLSCRVGDRPLRHAGAQQRWQVQSILIVILNGVVARLQRVDTNARIDVGKRG